MLCEPQQVNRKRGYTMLFDLFSKNTDLPNDEITKLAINLERGIFNACVSQKDSKTVFWNNSFRDQYISHFLHIYHNLNPLSHIGNPNLLKRFLNKEFSIDQLCREMTGEDMFPERYYDYHQIQQEELDKIEVQKKQLEGVVGIHFCGKCKTNKTTYYQLQTRSADEPRQHRHGFESKHQNCLLVKLYSFVYNFATFSNCGKSLRAFTTIYF
jgi:transcription elongation factor S-II